MQQLSATMLTSLAKPVTTHATCWKLTRRDSTVLGFTDHDKDVVIGAVTYRAAAGMSATAVTSSLGLRVDNLEIEGLLSDAAISESDLLSGLYDYAQIDVYLVDYTDLGHGMLHIKTGWLGEITMRAGQFIGEVRGLSNALQSTIGEVYKPTCRAAFGDMRCGFSLASVTVSGVVTLADGRFGFTDAARLQDDGYFDYGVMTMTSGANIGQKREVKRYQSKQFTLSEPYAQALMVGDHYSVVAGCDKRFDTCSGRFNNAKNFRGEPHVPGTDRILKTAGTR